MTAIDDAVCPRCGSDTCPRVTGWLVDEWHRRQDLHRERVERNSAHHKGGMGGCWCCCPDCFDLHTYSCEVPTPDIDHQGK